MVAAVATKSAKPKPIRSAGQRGSQKRATAVRRLQGNHRARSAAGVMRSDEVLTLSAFVERLGVTRAHVNEMRRRAKELGIVLARRDGGRNVLIHGADYLAYVAKLPEAELD